MLLQEWRGFGGSLEAAKEDVAARVGNTLEAPTQPLGVSRGGKLVSPEEFHWPSGPVS